MKLFTSLLLTLWVISFCGCGQATPQSADDATYFLYIKIPEQIAPDERGRKYEDPINDMLSRLQLGEVSGGGTMLTKDKQIEYVGVDVDVTDPQKAIPLLLAKLKELGAPKGTVIEQEEPEKKIFTLE